MIKEIVLKNIATYSKDSETIMKPSKVNFIYGNNGTGKTTIARLIKNFDIYEDSKILWDSDLAYSRLVYNQDFVKKNFNAETKIRGIYTLGEESEETYKKIEDLNSQKKEILEKIESKKKSLKQKEDEINNYRENIQDKFWNDYKKK